MKHKKTPTPPLGIAVEATGLVLGAWWLVRFLWEWNAYGFGHFASLSQFTTGLLLGTAASILIVGGELLRCDEPKAKKPEPKKPESTDTGWFF